MPAAWIGRSPAAIAESVRDMMVSMLRPDTVFVELRDRERGQTHVATAHNKTVTVGGDNQQSLYRDITSKPLLIDSEIDLSLASLPIGLNGELGRVAVGCVRPAFPSRAELVLMQVAANQIAVALSHAELLIKHEKAELALERARIDAENASRRKSEFLGMMSHELRTPLNAIGGYVQILEEGMRGPVTPEQRVDLARMRRNSEFLLRIIDNVLGYLKLGSGLVSYQITEIPVDDVVDACEDYVRPQIAAKGLRYERRGGAERSCVRADPDKVQQILLNLLSNAIKFTDRGVIAIEWAAYDNHIGIRVVDTGPGIPAERLDTVFEPFVQIDSSRRRPAGGTGLGLSISRDFALGMGGSLGVESELGRGSTFTLRLERAPDLTSCEALDAAVA